MEDYIRIEVKSITKPMKLFISCYFYDIYLGSLSRCIKPIFFLCNYSVSNIVIIICQNVNVCQPGGLLTTGL